MTTAIRILEALVIVALLSSATVHAAESHIVIALEEGKQVASFKIANASCVLKDDQIRCTPTNN